ncbi:type II secretion system GspH family protein [Pendulispora rubella]|uniref:Type II secretion system GspH family protein n=1 Tax=Pendulispora rubella TaxID=2741070 RepID=A0ABZ2LE01_9BACT
MKLSWSQIIRHSRRAGRASRERGVTLIEILIVLAIIGLIAGGVAMTAIPKFAEAQKQTTRQSAQVLRQAAQLWRTTGGGDCPTVEVLKRDKQLESSSKLSDAWEQPFKILCDDDETTVVSAGPDKKEGTADDIRVPAPEAPAK